MTGVQSARSPTPGTAEFRPYLEGLRGLCALYVVMHHATLQVFGDITWLGRGIQIMCLYGHYAVAVFIVVSGYCLMLPVTRTVDGRLRGGFRDYIRRRARRILPPYYAAIALVLGAIAVVPGWHGPGGIAASWDVVVAHLLLVHNVNGAWIGKLDSPLWSVATEWQIYFVVPILLGIWRRWGMGWAVGFGFALGYAVALGFFAAVSRVALDACPYYLGLFALGMAAAHRAARSPARLSAEARRSLAKEALGVLAFALLFVAVEHKTGILARRGVPERVVLDAVVGVATAGFILYCGRAAARGDRVLSLRVLEHPWVLVLGAMSYSLYLIHDPLLIFQNLTMIALGLSDRTRFWMLFLVGIPIIVGITFLFYLAVERRFTARAPRRAIAILLPPASGGAPTT